MTDVTSTSTSNKWWLRYIHLEMIPAKVTYLLCEGYMGSILPFLNIFFVTLGLTPAEAGLITGISFAVAAVAGPVWSSLIETTGHRKIIFIILCLGATTTVFSMPWVAKAVGNYTFNMTCHHQRNFTSGKGPLFHFKKMKGCFLTRHLTNRSVLFYTLLSLSVTSRIFFVTIPSYIDSIVVAVVKTRKRVTSYGEQRVFGVLGFGIANFIAGLAIDHYRPKNLSPFTAAFYVFLPCVLLLMPVGYKLISQVPNEEMRSRRSVIASFSSHMISFLRKADTIIFLLTVTVSGAALNVLFNFLILFMMQEMHSPKIIITLTFLVCMLTQLIGFPFSAKVIQLIGGPVPVFIIGIFSYFPRFIMMSYITNPWLALPIQLFEPIGLAFSWAAQIEHTYQIAPKEITLTSINIIATVHFVASSAIANILGGFAYHRYGGRLLFRGMGILCGIWSFLITLYYGIKYLKSRRTSVENGYQNDIEI